MSERVLPFDDPIYQEMCRAVALGSVRGPYTQVVDGVPHLDMGAVVAEIIASPALAEVRRQAAEEAWEEGWASAIHGFDLPDSEPGDLAANPYTTR